MKEDLQIIHIFSKCNNFTLDSSIRLCYYT